MKRNMFARSTHPPGMAQPGPSESGPSEWDTSFPPWLHPLHRPQPRPQPRLRGVSCPAKYHAPEQADLVAQAEQADRAAPLHAARAPGRPAPLSARWWFEHLCFEALNLALVEGTQTSCCHQLTRLNQACLEQAARLVARGPVQAPDRVQEEAPWPPETSSSPGDLSRPHTAGAGAWTAWGAWGEEEEEAWGAWAETQDNKVRSLQHEFEKLAWAIRELQVSVRGTDGWNRDLEVEFASLRSAQDTLASQLGGLAQRLQAQEVKMEQVLRLSSQGVLAAPPGLGRSPQPLSAIPLVQLRVTAQTGVQ